MLKSVLGLGGAKLEVLRFESRNSRFGSFEMFGKVTQSFDYMRNRMMALGQRSKQSDGTQTLYNT